MKLKIMITGGCGFIGSNLIRHIIKETNHVILNIDKLTYAGSKSSLNFLKNNNRYNFKKIDITNSKKIENIIFKFKPNWVMHLAAESHVDRSIDSPNEFINTNINGTYNLLNISRKYFCSLSKKKKKLFKFHHISTDEVYGDLGYHAKLASEQNKYFPSSTYSASKASSDHLVRAWHKTFGLPIIITNTSNNFGPYQFPEKLIPHTILNLIFNKKIPIYGDGKQIRDWIYVEDHVDALLKIINKGQVGETYNIGGNNQLSNLFVIKKICDTMNKIYFKKNKINFSNSITFVKDRPGHDLRYGINQNKIYKLLKWKPKTNFSEGIEKTVKWYLNNKKWWNVILHKGYKLKRKGKL